jgi:hypothetical protein
MATGAEASCAICWALAKIAEDGGVNADDVSNAYAEGFGDGVVAVLKGMRRDMCATHEAELNGSLAERNIRMARAAPAAHTKTRQ